ncbi:hypothetical protein ACFE04_023902 [Oxalis oulophora]
MDSSAATPSLHLAMAALLGATFMAISAFYIHKRSVDNVLDRLIEVRRHVSKRRRNYKSTEEDEVDDDVAIEEVESDGFDEEEDDDDVEDGGDRRRMMIIGRNSSVDGNDGSSTMMMMMPRFRASCSLPNVMLANQWFEEDDETVRNRAESQRDQLDSVPSSLPLLQRSSQGQLGNHSGAGNRVASFGRLMTPRSPGGRNVFESGDSDQEEAELANEEDDETFFSHGNVDSFTDNIANDVNLNVQTYATILSKGVDSNSVHDQASRPAENEAIPDVSLQAAGHVDRPAARMETNGPTLANGIAPMRTVLQEPPNKEDEEVRIMLRECLDLRDKYLYREKVAPWSKGSFVEPGTPKKKTDPFHVEPVKATPHHWRMEDGVVHVYASENDKVDLFPVANATRFFTDVHHLLKVMSIGNVRSVCHHRLRFLEEKFRLYLLVNADKEFLAQKGAPHRDFYNIRKVDTHIHHSACMNQKHLLRFIKSKLRKEPDEVVIFRDGKYMTLKEVFESLDLTGYDLNVDLLDVHADKSTFHRFDKFNLKYNPCGQSRLREIFLKQDNLIQGRFLAQLTKEVLSDLEASKYQMAEYRISIYGRKQSEWDMLASWFINNEIYSENAVWLIQLPRLYNVYKDMGIVKSFQNILDNVFIPLFEATIDPSSHPQLYAFLLQVVGFDIVDDESKPERRPTKHMPKPSEWTNGFNPAYSYYAYYCYANLYTLNKLRESKGLPTIRFRPHCGEAGDVDHLAAAFLLCTNISHGIVLRKTPVLQYLYYLAQIGLAMSPLSNNSLFLDYHRNPFLMYFQRGMNVSLSSDDPLQIHLTKEALVEEYSVAAKVWKLSACDLCEIARNSVYQSGFSHEAKSHWLGGKYYLQGPEGNNIHKTNVPNMRITFRRETWKEEMQYVYSGRAIFPEEIET